MHSFKHSKVLGIILLIIGICTLLGVILNSYFLITIGNTVLSLLFIVAGVRLISDTHGPNCQCKMCRYRRQVEDTIDKMADKNEGAEEVIIEEEVVE